jgi:Protein of unknown function (DUF2628)
MAIFTVHIPAARAGEAPSAEKIVLLRDGFSLPAMLLGPFWLAWNRAWLPAIGWTTLLALIVFAGVKLGASSETLSLVTTALALLLGFEGSRLVAWSLARRHYNESAVIIGETPDEAEEIFFYNWRGASAVAPPPPPPPPPMGASEEPSV